MRLEVLIFKTIILVLIESGAKRHGNYLQVYLEKFKYKSKKTKTTKFINTELESELDSKLEFDAELELQSGSESDTE